MIRFRVNIYTATDWQARVAYIFINTYLVRRDVCFAQETEAKKGTMMTRAVLLS